MNKILATAIGTALLVGPLAYGVAVYQGTGDGKSPARTGDVGLVSDVMRIIRDQYVEPVDEEKLIDGALNGMLSSLDPHSSYMSSKEFADFNTGQVKGEFGGLGMELTQKNGLVTVVAPMDDTPAGRADIKAGDLITHVDGESIIGVKIEDAVAKMKGTPGSSVTLTVRRGEQGEPFQVPLVRETIKLASVKQRIEGNDIGYIRIIRFSEQTQPGLEKAISSFKQQLGPKLGGIVLDLRNNPGGLLNQAISVSNTFLSSGDIVSTRGRKESENETVSAAPGKDMAAGIPVVVLINGGSASASEIVAGALQDNHRAIIMGEQSFGKGSVQEIQPLKNRGALHFTIAHYYTPSGRSIQAKGITPDIEVHPARIEEVEQQRMREADLKGALPNPDAPSGALMGAPGQPSSSAAPQAAKKGTKAPDEAAKTAEPPPPFDYQLARAVDLLHGVSLFRNRAVN